MKELLDWFGEPGHAAFSAFLVSVGALIVSIVSLVVSRRTQKRSVEIEERRERDRLREQRRARLVALGGQEVLRIDNRGQGVAREIAMLVDGAPLAEHDRIQPFDPVPLQHLEAQAHLDYRVVAFDGAPALEVEITWMDDTGERGRFQGTVQV